MTNVSKQAGGNKVYQLPIPRCPAVRDTLADVAVASLDAEIRALADELAQFDDKTRQTTVERRLDRYEQLQGRVALFSGVLSFKADELTARLSAIQNNLRVQLGVPTIPFRLPPRRMPACCKAISTQLDSRPRYRFLTCPTHHDEPGTWAIRVCPVHRSCHEQKDDVSRRIVCAGKSTSTRQIHEKRPRWR